VVEVDGFLHRRVPLGETGVPAVAGEGVAGHVIDGGEALVGPRRTLAHLGHGRRLESLWLGGVENVLYDRRAGSKGFDLGVIASSSKPAILVKNQRISACCKI